MYYLFASSVFLVFYIFSGNHQILEEYNMLYKEELHNLSGLVNEIISSAEGRVIFEKEEDKKRKMTGLEESVMLTICEGNL